MRSTTLFIVGLALVCAFSGANADDGLARALSVDSSCEIDLNNDSRTDIAFIAETSRGYELIVLLRKIKGYKTYLLYQGKPAMTLTCHRGKVLKVPDSQTSYRTNGAYLMLEKFGKPTIAYYWSRRKFSEVWMAE